MDCSQCRSHLEEYALDQDVGELSLEISEHLSSCSTCRDELAELRETWSLLTFDLDPIPVSQRLEARVLDRLESGPNRVELKPTVNRWMRISAKYLVAAGVLFCLTIGYAIVLYSYSNGSQSPELQVNIENDLDGSDSPNVRFVALRKSPFTAPQAWVIFYLESQEVHVIAEKLEQKKAEEHYRVWIMDDTGDVISAAVIETNDQGVGNAVLVVSKEISRNGVVLLTIEDEEDSAFPSERIIARGQIHSPTK